MQHLSLKLPLLHPPALFPTLKSSQHLKAPRIAMADTLPFAVPVYLCLNGGRFSKPISRSKAPIARMRAAPQGQLGLGS